MVTNFYLVCNDRGTTRSCTKRPAVKANEVAIKCCLQLPNSLFTKPQITAEITIPESSVTPAVLSTETINNVKDAIISSTGLEVKLVVLDANS